MPNNLTQSNDLLSCESEPIHIPGKIQPFGFLIAIKKSDLKIQYFSENTLALFSYSKEEFSKLTISEILNESDVTWIQSHAETTDAPFSASRVIEIKEKENIKKFTLSLHLSGEDIYLLEIEKFSKEGFDLYKDFYYFLSACYNQLSIQTNILSACNYLAERMKEFTGYDRVMIYRFDKNWHGQVIAEKKEPHLNSYLNLFFPASDIPSQARELYLRKEIRMISDVNYIPSAIIPSDNENKPLDLSNSDLRSVSPIHIEYLQNMEVKATLVISIIKEDKLWGLIACHHYSQKYIDTYMRSACKVVAMMFSSYLRILSNREIKNHKSKLLALESTLARQVYQSRSIAEGLTRFPINLLSLNNASGASVKILGDTTTIGLTPSTEEINDLMNWLSDSIDQDIYFTIELSSIYPKAKSYKSKTCGILAICLSRESKEYIIWFKPEVPEKIEWGGNPEEFTKKEKDFRLSPRKSFEKWQQEVLNTSSPWSPVEIEIAEVLKNDINNLLASSFFEVKQANQFLEKIKYELESTISSRTVELEKLNEEIQREIRAREIVEKEMETFFSISNDIFVILDRNAMVKKINHSWNRILGHDENLLRKSPITTYLYPDDLSATIEAARLVFNNPDYNATLENRYIHKDGTYRWLSRSFKLNSEYDLIFASARDITERKNMEFELVEAKELAEEMSRLKTNFLYNLSHEIRTPLNGIIGLAQIIQTETHLMEIYKYSTLQIQSGIRLFNTLNSILHLAKLESVNFSFTKSPCKIDYLIVKEINNYKPFAERKKLDFRFEFHIKDTVLLGNEEMFSLVISNLIDNSIKFTENGEISIKVSHPEEDNSTLKISIKDSGLGIRKENVKKIFNPLTQESEGLSRKYEGLGIGLYLVKKYTELMNGQIILTTEKGKGSTFELLFPIHRERKSE